MINKEGGTLSNDELVFLNQLVSSLEEAEIKLEASYKEKNYEYFSKLKQFILEIQKKMDEILR